MSQFNMSEWQRNRMAEQSLKYSKTVDALRAYAKAHPEIEKVVWFFDGAGDSSNETFLAEEPDDHLNAYGTPMEYPEEDDLSSLMWDLMDSSPKTSGWDWYNGEGGFGYLVVDLKTSQYTMHFNQRIESTEYHEEGGSL